MNDIGDSFFNAGEFYLGQAGGLRALRLGNVDLGHRIRQLHLDEQGAVQLPVYRVNRPALRYDLKSQDLDWRGASRTFSEAIDKAFELTGYNKNKFFPAKWGRDKNGKSFPAEWVGPGGAEVNIDWSHYGVSRTGEWVTGPDAPHIGWQVGKKRKTVGHIILDEVPYNRWSMKKDIISFEVEDSCQNHDVKCVLIERSFLDGLACRAAGISSESANKSARLLDFLSGHGDVVGSSLDGIDLEELRSENGPVVLFFDVADCDLAYQFSDFREAAGILENLPLVIAYLVNIGGSAMFVQTDTGVLLGYGDI